MGAHIGVTSVTIRCARNESIKAAGQHQLATRPVISKLE